MKIRYTIEKVNAEGASETSSRDFESGSIRLGRGAGADILLESSVVALSHAVIKIHDGKLIIEDLNSSTGVQVNGSLVQSGSLKAGDKIKLGDVTLQVSQPDGIWTVTERRKIKDQTDEFAQLKSRLSQLDISSGLPPLRWLSALLIFATVIGFGLYPYLYGSKREWSSGPIANVHKMIEHDCAACHSQPFQQVQDSECQACHKLTQHAGSIDKFVHNHPTLNRRCAQCHMDHNGDAALIGRDSAMCVSCHGDLKKLLPDALNPNVPSFEKHPEFRVRVVDANDPTKFSRVSLDDKANLKDNTPIKLNHKIHLEPGIRGDKGPVTMQCRDCHAFSPDLKNIEPITFDKNCRSCHPLGFDERMPNSQVPHGDADLVFNSVFAEYAKLHLSIEKKDDQGRFIPGQANSGSASKEDAQAKQAVQVESRQTEEMLFTKTACQLCHMVSENSNVEAGKSRYSIKKPNIPVNWEPAAIFDHGTHQQIQCQDCHVGVKDSTSTSDVLLPGIANCRQCHADGGVPKKVASDCAQCHSHHDAMEFEDGKRRLIKEMVAVAEGHLHPKS